MWSMQTRAVELLPRSVSTKRGSWKRHCLPCRAREEGMISVPERRKARVVREATGDGSGE